MAESIVMPELGQNSSDATIIEWNYKVGDTVELGEPLLVVETDKGQLDVEAAAEGVLLKTMADVGETVSAGTKIAWVGEKDEEPPK